MSSDTRNIALNGSFKNIIKEKHDHIKVALGDSIDTWYIMYHNLGGALEGAELIFKLKAQENYPYDAPIFNALTPNGICNVNVPVCIDIGHYHKENMVATLGMAGFVNILLGLLTQSVVETNKSLTQINGLNFVTGMNLVDIRKYASASVQYNDTHLREIKQRILTSYAGYSPVWTKKSRAEDRLSRLKK